MICVYKMFSVNLPQRIILKTYKKCTYCNYLGGESI